MGGARHYEVRPDPTTTVDGLRLLRRLARAYPATIGATEVWWETRRAHPFLTTATRGWGSVHADRMALRSVDPVAWFAAGAGYVEVISHGAEAQAEMKVALQFDSIDKRGDARLTLWAPGGGDRAYELPAAAERWLKGLGSTGNAVRSGMGGIKPGTSIKGVVSAGLAQTLLASEEAWRGPDVELRVTGTMAALSLVPAPEGAMRNARILPGSIDDAWIDDATSDAGDDFMMVDVLCEWSDATGGYNLVSLVLNARRLGLRLEPGVRQVVVAVNYKTDLSHLHDKALWIDEGCSHAEALAWEIGRSAGVDLDYIGTE